MCDTGRTGAGAGGITLPLHTLGDVRLPFERAAGAVEEGQAPARITAKLPDTKGKLIRSLPLFPYPQVAKYKGSGSTDDAANFIGANPTQ